MDTTDVALYAAYAAVGVAYAVRMRHARGDQDPVLWFAERAAGWPLYALAHLLVVIERWRSHR